MLCSRAWAAWTVVAVVLALADNDVVDVSSDVGMLEPQLGASLGTATPAGAVPPNTTAPTAAASSGGTPPAGSNASAPTNASAKGNGTAIVDEKPAATTMASFDRPARPHETENFAKIPFFVFKDGASREEKAKSAQDCEVACNQRKRCKSFSFSARKSDCLWSTHALSFNGEFQFWSRRAFTDPKESGRQLMGKYRRFDGLMYQTAQFTTYQGKSLKECRKFCDMAVDGHGRKCNGFSYREKSMTCMLSPYGLSYDPDYDYYERNPKPIDEMVEKPDENGNLKMVPTGKKLPAPLDAPYSDSVPAWNESPQYQAQLQIQENGAKAGAIELGHKQRTQKRSKKAKKSLESQIEVMKEEEEEKKPRPKLNGKAVSEQIEKREEAGEQEEKATNKRYQVMLEMEKEAEQKKEEDAQRKVEEQHEKEQEKLGKELKIKTEIKNQQAKLALHQELQRKKIGVLVNRGKALAHQERVNKEKAYNAAEHNAKEKIVKMQVEKVIANRHSRHEKQFDQFVKDSTERHLKTRDTDKSVSIAMKEAKKVQTSDLTNVQEELKSTRAIVHAISLEIEKLKAQADGYQHEINMDAKRGKKSPQAEVKLQYTMNQLRSEQNKEAFRRHEVMKMERDVLERQDKLKKLDTEMTKKGVGRRRRQVEDATHAGPQAQKNSKPIMPDYPTEASPNPALDRRRRTQARLQAEYMSSSEQASGDGRTVLPGVPMAASTFTGENPEGDDAQ